jgi:ribonuclease VapC
MILISADTSVVVAILEGEPEWRILDSILTFSNPLISAVSLLRSWPEAFTPIAIDEILHQYDFQVIEFGFQHLARAQAAFEKYGKGRHPAKLNLGDCIVCATANLRRRRYYSWATIIQKRTSKPFLGSLELLHVMNQF